jgi:ligand-binding SRPBCC domain-containing protein
MPIIELHTNIAAPPERVFDLSRSVSLHIDSAGDTGERVVEGKLRGLLEDGEHATWEARHFGLRMRLTSRVIEFDRPHRFVSNMLHGPFKKIYHEHIFQQSESGTHMIDRFDFDAPLGFLGRIAEALFLKRHMTRFLEQRNRVLKEIAESERWSAYM